MDFKTTENDNLTLSPKSINGSINRNNFHRTRCPTSFLHGMPELEKSFNQMKNSQKMLKESSTSRCRTEISFKDCLDVACFIPSHLSDATFFIRLVERALLQCRLPSDSSMQPRILILLRGLPGSGKSFIANAIKQTLGAVICSADDYFVDESTGLYVYDSNRVQSSHKNCMDKAHNFIKNPEFSGIIIIDNTNLTCFEMEFYIKEALSSRMEIMVLEPHTEWSRRPVELAKRTRHNVPADKIQVMRKRYESADQVYAWITCLKRQLSSCGDAASVTRSKEKAIESAASPSRTMAENGADLEMLSLSIDNQEDFDPELFVAHMIYKYPDMSETVVRDLAAESNYNGQQFIHLMEPHLSTGSRSQPEGGSTAQNCGPANEVPVLADLENITDPLTIVDEKQTCSADRQDRQLFSVPLSLDFLREAQNKFSINLQLEQVEFDCLPHEEMHNWSVPEDLALLLFAHFMLQKRLGGADKSARLRELFWPRLEVHSFGSGIEAGVRRCSSLSNLSSNAGEERGTSSADPPDRSSVDPPLQVHDVHECLPFREIMALEMALQNSVEDQRHILDSTAIKMRLKLLCEMFPVIEANHMERMLVQFGFRSEDLIDHLLELKFVPMPTAKFQSTTSKWKSDSRGGCFDSLNSAIARVMLAVGDTEDLREWNSQSCAARLTGIEAQIQVEVERRKHLAGKLHSVIDRKMVSGVSQFYKDQLNSTSRLLQDLFMLKSHLLVSLNEEALIGGGDSQTNHVRLDLHHMTRRDAVQQLKFCLAEMRRDGHSRLLTIITGYGQHSVGPAVLRPTIKQFLASQNLSFEETYPGTFLVKGV